MQNIEHICLQIMPPSMTESLGASKRPTALYMSFKFSLLVLHTCTPAIKMTTFFIFSI